MTDAPKPTAWSRVHQNGMVALVFQTPEIPDRFAAGAGLSGAAQWLANVPGPLMHAQHSADVESKCPQPCKCPPWHE